MEFKLDSCQSQLKYLVEEIKKTQTYMQDLDFVIDNISDEYKPKLLEIYKCLSDNFDKNVQKMQQIQNKIMYLSSKKSKNKYI